MLQIYFFYTYTRDNTYGRVPLPHPPPLGVQYIILNNRWIPPPPTPCSEIIYIWRLFGARVDVNLNLQNAQKQTVFSTQIFKKSPLWEGYTPGGGGGGGTRLSC